MQRVVRSQWVFCSALPAVGAQDSDGKQTFTVCAYNVDGLPNSIAGIEINPDGKGEEGAAAIGSYLSEKQFDVIALSEDFNFHSSLMAPPQPTTLPAPTAVA